MLLQVNDSGAWRNVVRYKACDEEAVRDAALVLAAAGQPNGGMRIVDDGIVVAYCELDKLSGWYAWRAA